MAEPFAASVLNSLLQPRVPLARVTRSKGNTVLAANFFTPVPRQSKHKSRDADAPAVGHILECQAWAYPPTKPSLWGHDGSMRTTLMGELTPTDARGRVRRTSKSNRPRLASMEQSNGHRLYHVSHSSAAQPARDYSRTSYSNLEVADEEPVASTSASSPASPVTLFCQALEKGTLSSELSAQFDALESSGRLAELPTYEVIELAEILADQIDSLCTYLPDAHLVREWGQRLQILVDLVDESASPSNFPVDSELVDSLRTRSTLFMGDFAEARELDEQELQRMNPAYQRQSYASRVLALSVHNSISAAINYVFVETSSRRKLLDIDAHVADNFLHLFTRDNMHSALAATAQWEPDTRNALFDFVLHALAAKKEYAKSLAIIREMRQEGAVCPSNLLAEACKGLASVDEIEAAEEVFAMIPRDDSNSAPLEQYISLLRKPPDKDADKPAAPADRSQQIRMTMSKFNQLFPKGHDGIRTPKPSLKIYIALMAHLAHLEKYERGIEIGEELMHDNFQPDVRLAGLLMRCYFGKSDTLGVTNFLKYLKQFDFKGDNLFYTLVIRYFGTHLDPTAAVAVFDEAIANGVTPDKQMYRRLMGAYFRSGCWKEAISLFLKLKEAKPELVDIHAYNVVLQGCLFMGAPFRTVFKMFMIMEKQGYIPNKYSYAILVRGALDAGQFQFVQDIYREIMAKPNWEELIDVAFFTNVVTGYIRIGKQAEARKMLKKMRQLRIKPTAVTHGAIARAYATAEGEGGLELAEEYIYSVVTNKNDQSWRDASHGKLRKDPMALLYGFLIDRRCYNSDVDSAERLVGEYLNNGGQLTIGILKSLLSMYGKLDRLDDFRTVWKHIVELAMKPYRARENEDDKFATKMRSITAPVDIYTNTLSRACCHREVAKTWGELSSRQHAFDASNWHAFAHACLRAGQIEQAFAIMEHSFQPLFSNALRNHFRKSPDVDAPHDEKIAYYKRLYWVPPPKPLIEPASRVRAARTNKAVNRNKYLLTDEHAMEVDFSFPLTLLRRIGPNWHDWKPRMALLESLLMAMMYLEDGFPIRAMAPGEERAHSIAAEKTENRGATEALLKTLHENHPKTMYRLRRFRYKETVKLGGYGMKKKYILSRVSS